MAMPVRSLAKMAPEKVKGLRARAAHILAMIEQGGAEL
jgi:hypothetical protein